MPQILNHTYMLNIKKAIKDKGLQVKDVADILNISVVGLSKNINGNPSVATLQRIADAIGCRIIDLFDDEQDEQNDKNTIICPHCGKSIQISIAQTDEI